MAEELTRALNLLAERGEPRGAEQVFERARDEVAHRPPSRYPGWKSGLAIVVAAAAAVAILIGAVVLITWPAATDSSPVITAPLETVTTATSIPPAEPGRLDRVHDLAVAPDGSLWAATAGGIVRWDLQSGTPEVFGPADGLGGGPVMAIAASPDGTVWGAGESWIARFDGTWQTWDSIDLNLPTPIGDIAVGPDGMLWAAAGKNLLLKFDGTDLAASKAAPTQHRFEPWTDSIAVGPDGTVWATLLIEPTVLAFDGEWRTYALPGPAGNVSIGTEGSVWVGGDGLYGDRQPDVPPGGITRYDRTGWTTFTIADGLLSNDANVAAGPDGTVWAIHTALPPEIADRLGVDEVEGISHFDGSAWMTYPISGVQGRKAAVSPDGTLWMPSSGGIVGFDGAATTTLLAGADREPPPAPAGSGITLERAESFESIRLSTSIGDIQFTTWQIPEEWRPFPWTMAPTPHGVAAVIPLRSFGSRFIWSTDGRTWKEAGISLPIFARGIAAHGDELLLYGDEGVAVMRWDGSEWVNTALSDLDRADQVVLGPAGIVAVDGTRVFHSSDGERFLEAERPPDPAAHPAAEGGTCNMGPHYPDSRRPPRLGPVVATDTGFFALAPLRASDWTQSPACDPLVWFSADGNVWEMMSEESPFGGVPSFGGGAFVDDLTVHDGLLVAAGGGGSSGGSVWISDDGLTWEQADLDVAAALRLRSGLRGLILLGNAQLPASPLEVGEMWFSPDGMTWDGPFQRPEGWEEGLLMSVSLEAAVLEDLIVGWGAGAPPDDPQRRGYVVVGEFLREK